MGKEELDTTTERVLPSWVYELGRAEGCACQIPSTFDLSARLFWVNLECPLHRKVAEPLMSEWQAKREQGFLCIGLTPE